MTKQDPAPQLPELLDRLRAWVDGRQLEDHIAGGGLNEPAILYSDGQTRGSSILPETVDTAEPPDPLTRHRRARETSAGNRRASVGHELQRALRAIVRQYPDVTWAEIERAAAAVMPSAAGPKAARQLPATLVQTVINTKLLEDKKTNLSKAYLWLSRELGVNERTVRRAYKRAR